MSHIVHEVLTPSPLKNTIPFLAKHLPLNQQTVQALLFKQYPPLYWFFVKHPPPSLKIGFFIFNPNLTSITKFFVKISQSEFLVMTEKKIFVCKLFLSLNISDFRFYFIFYVKTTTPNPPHPLKKITSLFPTSSPLKINVMSSPPLFENLVGGSTPLPPPKYLLMYIAFKLRFQFL